VCPPTDAGWYLNQEGTAIEMSDNAQLTPPEVASIGSRLRRLRKERHLTQAELARQIGIQQSDLSRMEKGEYRVSLDKLFKILAVFDLELGDFFGEPLRHKAPLSQENMQILHQLRELSPEGRAEVQEYLEFKLRRERSERRATDARRAQKVES
jgi:transcriptional regulator with XRE-family HTH domain